jgi:hypothetical protein
VDLWVDVWHRMPLLFSLFQPEYRLRERLPATFSEAEPLFEAPFSRAVLSALLPAWMDVPGHEEVFSGIHLRLRASSRYPPAEVSGMNH